MSTLTAAQKTMGNVLAKLVLTSGATTKTYGVDTTNRILHISHIEDEWHSSATVLVDNREGTLTSLALEGYQGILSYGYNTSAGDEYSATAPLEVIGQKGDSVPGDLIMAFTMAGIWNMMDEDEASAAYTPTSANDDTVQTILTKIANATLSCFSHCKNYTINIDSTDSLINTYKPADYFSVGFKESRTSAFRKALKLTKCKAIIKADGQIHVFNPTISGTTYDYEYNDAATEHNFFAKSTRTRLVIPNKITVRTHPDFATQYTGNATDSASYASLGRYMEQFHYIRPVSDAQCTAIATAILQHYQLGAEKGHGKVPMNVGQELFDYIKFTDSRANDTRVGNVGNLTRTYAPGKAFSLQIRFGSLSLPGLAGTLSPESTDDELNEDTLTDGEGGSGRINIRALMELLNNILYIMDSRHAFNSASLLDLNGQIQAIKAYLNAKETSDELVLQKLQVIEQCIIPVWS